MHIPIRAIRGVVLALAVLVRWLVWLDDLALEPASDAPLTGGMA